MQTLTEAERVADYLERILAEVEAEKAKGEDFAYLYGRLVAAAWLSIGDLRRTA